MQKLNRINRKDLRLILTASNIVELECMINDYFFSKYYRVSDDLMLHNDAKRIELLSDYVEWYSEFNKMFKIYKTENGYKFYRYYGL